MAAGELITAVERRRRWSAAEKQAIVAESALPGRTVSGVARRHDIAPQQLFTWRRQFLAAAMGGPEDGLLPVVVGEAPLVPPSTGAGPGCGESGRIEIVLPDGVVVRVGWDVAEQALRRVLAALR